MSLTFKELRVANSARDVQWLDGSKPWTIQDRCVEIMGELGELCEVVKKIKRYNQEMRSNRNDFLELQDDLIRELADVAICVDQAAMTLGIDLGEAIKLKFNETSDRYDLSARL